MLITLIDSWQPFLKAGKPRWSWPCNARLRRVLCSDHMLVCPPWSHRIVPQVMRHGSQKMLAEIGPLVRYKLSLKNRPFLPGFSALPHFRWATWLRMWPGLEARRPDLLGRNTKRTPKRLDMFGKEVPQLFQVPNLDFFINLFGVRQEEIREEVYST